MRKKFLSTLLSLCMVLALLLGGVQAADIPGEAGDIHNFTATNTYIDEQFSDVPSTSWFFPNVKCAYEYGLMNGTSETIFNPNGKMSIAEAIALSCRLHSIYFNHQEDFPQGNPWYDIYITYAIKYGIIQPGHFENYIQEASRSQVATILVAALPKEEFGAINIVDDDTLPDVKMTDYGAESIYTLYRAGVLTGNDRYGTFAAETPIDRSAVAAIITRIVNPGLRQQFTLEPKPISVSSISVTPAAATIYIPDTLVISATVLPDNAADKAITWSTSNPDIATVNQGLITAVSPGTATIRATASNGVYCESSITVVKRDSIRILSVYGIPNSAGGVGPTIIWRNDSGKTIKYATFTATPYNDVGDAVASTIGRRKTVQLEVTGPIESFSNERDVVGGYFFYKNSIPMVMPGSSDMGPYVLHWSGARYYLQDSDYQNVFNISSRWEPIWYNYTISKIKISKVDIEYMDGSKETVSNPTIWHSIWWND